MGNQSTHTMLLPNGLSAYVFGSALKEALSAQDLDVLFLYDTGIIRPERVYDAVAIVRTTLSQIQPLPVHPLVLSLSEETEEMFRMRHNCLPLDVWLAQTEM
jgi:hypothetical protein